MSNKTLFLLIVMLCALPSTFVLSQVQETKFSFTLPSTATTSAGVYTADSALVRTLWSGVRYISGSHIEKWDGLLDNRTPAPPGNYHVKVLSHNVTYTWDGARIGNTSTALTGSSIHRANQPPFCIAIAGDSMFYGAGYQERFNTQFVVNLNTIGERNRIVPADGGTNQVTSTNCTDGNYVYWGGPMPDSRNIHFVFATRVDNNAMVNFSSGTSISTSHFAYSGISVTTGVTDAGITNMAVQKTGDYLFVARSGLNQLQVVNKTTGAIIQTLSITSIGPLAVDANDKLWLSHGSVVEKYTVNSNGTLTTTGITLSSITQPAAIAVSPDNNTVAVADAGINQQVIRGYSNTSGGSAAWTLGTPGGYMADATVTDYKFYFQDVRTTYPVSIAYQTDGSFWVSEHANYRIQHYSSSRTFLNRISYRGSSLFVAVDPNNSSRLFVNLLEYRVDNTKPIDNGQNGSWSLLKNWAATVTNANFDNGFANISLLFTYNNHTYTCIKGQNEIDVFELVAGGTLRKTKQVVSYPVSIGSNGQKILNTNGYGTGRASQYNIYNLTGLDGDNDPVWATSATETITAPVATSEDAVSGDFRVTGDKIYYFQANRSLDDNTDYHLAAFKRSNSNWAFKTAPGTSPWYTGNFPDRGEFDNGNGVNQAGAYMALNGNNLLWTYRGEFWKDVQTNYFNHYHTSGLFIGLFGRDKPSNDYEANPPGSEGNMQTGSWVQDTPDRAFLYSGGEGVFAGIHRWSITGLSTIQIQTCNFNPALNYIPPPVGLMDGLIHGSYLTTFNGWIASHASMYIDYFTYWDVLIGKKTASKYGLQDVSANYRQYGSSNLIRTVTRNLGTNSGLNTWKINGKISFDGSHVSNTGGQGGACYFEILDQTGKVIARLNEEEAGRGSTTTYVRGNNADLNIYTNQDVRRLDAIKSQPFAISNNHGTLTFNYATYAAITTAVAEPGADIMQPTTIRLRFTPGDYPKAISVADLQFTKDTTNHYRTKQSGDWGDLDIWESSADSITWNDATEIPNSSANSITIRTGHIIAITGSAAVDQLTIQNGAAINVAPKASLWINDGEGDDIKIVGTGKLTIQSDSSGTGRIGNSLGNINGNVVVEKYISSKNNKAYRLLAPSVNTAGGPKPYIRDNWQEGQNNTSVLANSNTVPGYGTHITGSLLGTSGFDAATLAIPSLLIYNQSAASPGFVGIANTNATNLEAKKGYLLYVRGDRSIDLQTNLLSSNTTLRATGTVLIGTQTFTGLESNGRLSLVTNPYPSSINWNTVATDASTANITNFENYCTYWDPNIGESGGYVNISVNGTKSNADNKTTEIPSGEAFFVKAKSGVTAPTFTIKESHKSSSDNLRAYRTVAQAQFATSLHYSTLTGRRIKADAVNAVFDSTQSAGVDGNDAEEIPNENENIALIRDNKMLGIETRPLIGITDTIFLRTQRLKIQPYEWQFQPVAFNRPNLKAYLEDKFLNTRTEINLTDSAITVISFIVTAVTGSAATDRFRVVFNLNSSLPVTLLSLKAYQKAPGIAVDWTAKNEYNIDHYEIEKSLDGRQFIKQGAVLAKTNGSTSNSYTWPDSFPKEGNNYYRIKTVDKNGKTAYSEIVNVKIGLRKESFEVYPNPLTGKSLIVQFNNIKEGDYTVSIINAVGQKIYSKKIEHTGGSASQSIILSNELLTGIYNLQVTGNGIRFNQRIIKQ